MRTAPRRVPGSDPVERVYNPTCNGRPVLARGPDGPDTRCDGQTGGGTTKVRQRIAAKYGISTADVIVCLTADHDKMASDLHRQWAVRDSNPELTG